MRHRKRGKKLNRNTAHRKALLRNLARALFLSPEGRIVTTTAKAKFARPFVERLVTIARRGDDAVRRRHVVSLLGDTHPVRNRAENADKKGAAKWERIPAKPRSAEDRRRWRREGLPKPPETRVVAAVDRLFKEIAPKFKERPGGYTRILKLQAHRLGDNAEQSLFAFVENVSTVVPSEPEAKPAKAKAGKAKPKKTEAEAGA